MHPLPTLGYFTIQVGTGPASPTIPAPNPIYPQQSCLPPFFSAVYNFPLPNSLSSNSLILKQSTDFYATITVTMCLTSVFAVLMSVADRMLKSSLLTAVCYV